MKLLPDTNILDYILKGRDAAVDRLGAATCQDSALLLDADECLNTRPEKGRNFQGSRSKQETVEESYNGSSAKTFQVSRTDQKLFPALTRTCYDA